MLSKFCNVHLFKLCIYFVHSTITKANVAHCLFMFHPAAQLRTLACSSLFSWKYGLYHFSLFFKKFHFSPNELSLQVSQNMFTSSVMGLLNR